MAKNKVINTVLQLRDNMSDGLLKAAKNAKKAGADIDDSMLSATRQVVAFKNKAVDGITSFAKTATGVGVAGVTALTAAFLSLDSATEEYRRAQGRLNTAYEAAGYSTQTATQAYRDFYGILGDTDTATEASQLLAKLAQSEQDVSTWTRIAAGVSGTFGDSLPIEGLIEASNETAKTGQVTGVLADALNWGALAGETFGVALKANTEANEDWNKAVSEASSAEDYFNLALESCGSEAERNSLIMDALARGYDTAADAFYKNNSALVASRNQQAALQEITAGLGETSSDVKGKVLELFGAMSDGTVRPGSALDWLSGKAESFSAWIDGLDFGALATKFDQGFGTAVQKAGDALQWCKENSDLLIGGLKLLAGAFGLVKIGQFNKGLTDGISVIGGFIGTLRGMTTATTTQTAVTGTATTAQRGLNAALKANPIGVVITLIEAAIAVGVLLYKNWDTVKTTAVSLWEKVKEVFSGIKDSIVSAFEDAKAKVSGFFSWLDDKIESIPILGTLYSGGKAVIGGAADLIGSLIGGNALGTSYWKGGVTRVNERGGEILNLPSGTQIIPHDVSQRMAGGRNVVVNVTVQGNVIGNRQYADELGETIVQRILRALDNM